MPLVSPASGVISEGDHAATLGMQPQLINQRAIQPLPVRDLSPVQKPSVMSITHGSYPGFRGSLELTAYPPVNPFPLKEDAQMLTANLQLFRRVPVEIVGPASANPLGKVRHKHP